MGIDLASELTALRDRLLCAEAEHADLISRVRDRHRASARNLVHYVALRRTDLRPLQEALSDAGLSSLGRMEAGVLGHVDAVLAAARALDGDPSPAHDDEALTPAAGRAILARNAENLLGPARRDRDARIMVTMPSEAATDPDLVARIAQAGMDLARVNCAHDDEDAWAAMITAVRDGPGAGRPAPLVAMDLAGPKVRTGPLEPGPRVVKVKPARDRAGAVIEPSRVWLAAGTDGAGTDGAGAAADGPEGAVVVPLAAPDVETLAGLEDGDEIELTDARGAHRRLEVERATAAGVLVRADKTVYWATGTALATPHGPLEVGPLPPLEQTMRVHEGQEIILTRSLEPAPAVDAPPYRIGLTLAQAFADVAVGDRVSIDDGRIGTRITAVSDDEITLEVTQAGPRGAKLRAEKGVNFPDTHLEIPALTDEDLAHIPFVAGHADMVNMSFVRSAEDVARLIDALEAEDAQDVDITLKIETVEAFRQLPRMLLEAMRWRDVGVMIARGDLAVEAGFERMAELQEEILWLCEAAHVPAIWATQVLESLAKSGLPSRAEITDAAMAQRAEAAMLNKGPYIDRAITALGDILGRMGGHASKKRDMLRRLESWSL